MPVINSTTIDNYIDDYLRASNPNYTSSRSVNRSVSLVDFFSLVEKAIRAKEAVEKVPVEKKLIFVSALPPELLVSEAIVFSLQSRHAGQFSQGSTGERKVTERTGHIRSIISHPEHPNEKLITVGKFYDNYISFRVFARDDTVAIKRMEWFEQLMDQYRWYFRYFGFPIVLEEVVGEKEQISHGDLLLNSYNILFFVRLDCIYDVSSQELMSIDLKIGPYNT